MATLNVRSFIYVRKPKPDGSLGPSELVPARYHEHGPAARYPDGGGHESLADMIHNVTRVTMYAHPYATFAPIENGVRIDYHGKYPNCDVQEVTWTED